METIPDELLRWYDRAARPLPWRETRDPYAVWVSEIMLQQTRVETVIPYYERFLGRFPTPEALASADEDAVLSMWSGLGYYRRARLLHRGVREVVARYGGQVPEAPEARRALPGVGRYTAGAIGSIAFDRPEPIVDGNVTRVLARLFRLTDPVGSAALDRALWDRAAALVPDQRPGDFNQAVMELGATVCTPRRPACEACPLSTQCLALSHGEVDMLPVPKRKRAPVSVNLAAVLATVGRGSEREVWLCKGDRALFGGLWSVPMTEGAPGEALRELGVRGRLQPEPRGHVEHVLTHRRLHVDVYRATGAHAVPSNTLRRFRPRDLQSVGVSSLTRKLLSTLG